MSDRGTGDATSAFEKAAEELGEPKYVLRLYVAGMTQRSRHAIEAVKKLCETELEGRYDLEVVDIYQQPETMAQEQIIAAPTLIKKLPAPLRRIIGDMSDHERVLVGLDIKPKDEKREND